MNEPRDYIAVLKDRAGTWTPPSLAEQHRNRCRNFRSRTKHDACHAGIPYAQFKDCDGLPCHDADLGTYRCPMADFPTEEEAQAYQVEAEARYAELHRRMVIAREAIIERIKASGREDEDLIGELPCPLCQVGTLRFGYAGADNKHVRAGCNTSGCVNWTE